MKFGYTTKKDRKAKLKVKKKIVEAIGWLVIQDVHFKHKLNVKTLKTIELGRPRQILTLY